MSHELSGMHIARAHPASAPEDGSSAPTYRSGEASTHMHRESQLSQNKILSCVTWMRLWCRW